MIFCSQAYAAQEPGSNLNVTLDFHQCGLDVISRNSQEPNSIVILDKDGKPTNNQAEAWGIPVEVCDSMCGPRGSSEAFDWPLFSAAIAQWLLPWLALTAQLPYETRDRTSNAMALMLAVGSPMLITHSLCITILNSRWLNRYFAKLRSENETRGKNQLAMLSAAVYILKEIQHVPISIGDTRQRFAQLVADPRNEIWWVTLREELKRTKRDFTYSLAAQAFWVTAVALIAMANFFSIVDRSTIRVIGVAVNSLWMWMIPVTVGWVWVGTQNSANTVRDCLMRASTRCILGVSPLQQTSESMIGFQDCSWESRDEQGYDREWNASDATQAEMETAGCLRRIWAPEISFFVCNPELG